MPASYFSPASILRRVCATEPHRAPVLLVLMLAPALAILGTAAQKEMPQPQSGDKEGLFLVARRGLGDPLFAKSTVLMLPVNDPLVIVGLIVNKPTHVALHQLLPDAHAFDKNQATAYFGGPVDIHSPSAIFRSTSPPEKALRIFDDVYVAFDADVVTALVKNSAHPSTLRVFLGRSQWGKAQLQRETLEGAWYSIRVDADPIFSDHPDRVWQTLLDSLEPKPYVDYHRPSARWNRRATAP